MSAVMDATCVTDNIDVGVTVTAQATGNAFQQDVTITVFNQDTSRVAPQVKSVTEFPQGTLLSAPSAGCIVRGAQLTCQHGVIGANSLDVLSVTAELSTDFADQTSSGQLSPTISSELSHAAFTDTEQLNNRASLQLQLDDSVASDVIASSSSAPDAKPTTVSAPGIDGRPVNDDNTAQIGGSAGMAIGSSGPLSLLLGALLTVFSTARRLREIRLRDPLPRRSQ
jgi:hypothetical protein